VMVEVKDLDNRDRVRVRKDGRLRALPIAPFVEVAKSDLSISLDDSGPLIQGQVSYATALFGRATMARLADHYLRLLEQLTTNPGLPYIGCSLLGAAEYERIVHEWNATEREHPRNRTLYEAFEEQAARTPARVAVVFEGEYLTYDELNKRSNQLARLIRARHRQRTGYPLAAGTLVALYLPRGLEMVVAILAVLKAGAAYVPLDIHYPQERLDYLLQDAGAELILTCARKEASPGASLPEDRIIEIGPGGEPSLLEDASNLAPVSRANDLAYVVYTSGTTGKPKGVMVEHKALVQFIHNFSDYISDRCAVEAKGILSLTPYVFDIFGLEYALPLTTGNSVVLSSVLTVTEKEVAAVEIIQQTPGAIQQLTEKFPGRLSHTVCLVGGEPLQPSIAASLLRSFKQVFNVYGPAETVIWSSACEVKDPAVNCIGRPLFNEQLYVLDADLLPVPEGVVGELYIGGAGLARGYLNRPELTAERFIPNPFATEKTGARGYTRLYKTGDLVRWLPDGNLSFIGRNDDQVKIRGFRIELVEVGYELLRVVRFGQWCVGVWERRKAAGVVRFLVGYYVAGGIGRLGSVQF